MPRFELRNLLRLILVIVCAGPAALQTGCATTTQPQPASRADDRTNEGEPPAPVAVEGAASEARTGLVKGSCTEQLAAIARGPLKVTSAAEQRALDLALLQALSGCEVFLLDRGGPALLATLEPGVPLYRAVIDGPADDQAIAYCGLLSRFAIAGDLRRQLFYAPELRPCFKPSESTGACDLRAREGAVFFALTPRGLGGDPERAQAWLDGATARGGQGVCAEDKQIARALQQR